MGSWRNITIRVHHVILGHLSPSLTSRRLQWRRSRIIRLRLAPDHDCTSFWCKASASVLKHSILPQGGHIDIKSQPLASTLTGPFDCRSSASVAKTHFRESESRRERKCVVPGRKEELWIAPHCPVSSPKTSCNSPVHSQPVSDFLFSSFTLIHVHWPLT